MKRIVVLILVYICSFSQIEWGGEPASFRYFTKNNNTLHSYSTKLNNYEIRKVLMSDTLGFKVVGISERINIDFLKHASYFEKNGIKIWMLRISVAGVYGIGLTFSKFKLHPGNRLFIYSSDRKIVRGSFDHRNNKESGKFTILPIYSNEIILELNVYGNSNIPIIEIESIDKIVSSNFLANNTSCLLDIFCVPYIEESRGIVAIYLKTDSSIIGLCSGSLINQDVSFDDLSPYVITARHYTKNSNISNFVFIFHYQKNLCNGIVHKNWYYSISGAKELEYTTVFPGSDISLPRIDINRIPPDFNIHYLGWDIRKYSHLDKNVICLHHPQLDAKKISKGTLYKGFLNKWRVKWDSLKGTKSVTLPGSSGSPLLSNYRIIGTLSGGKSSCDKPNKADYYGKLKNKWDKKWKKWLAPNSNPDYLNGRDPCYSKVIIEDRYLYKAVNYQPKNKVVIQAGDSIITKGNVIIEYDGNYKFTAGKSIILRPGFRAPTGVKFIATIEQCDNGIAEKIIPFVSNHENNTFNVSDNSGIIIFPNPVRNTLNVQGDKTTIRNVEVYNIQGAKIMSKKFNNLHKVKFDISFLPSGVYILKVNSILINKIVKL